MSEIDLTLALQLQAQFEEEARVYLLQQEVERRKAEEISAIVTWQGSQSSSSTTNSNIGGRPRNGLKGHLEEPDQEKLSVSLIDPSWELIDPNPDIHSLFIAFNRQFFWGRLNGVEVKWSPRMTLCAGVCSYEGRGGLCSVRLSVPLLKLRPRKDLIETLLHEMIHAYLFVTANNRDRDGHGPEFHKHMYRINRVAGTHISVYHSFHDEVDVYRQHVWRCNGPCRTRRPYFGLVKRAMNRPPGPRDPWWQQHQNTCGGSYTKIQEPEGYGNKKKGKVVKKDTVTNGDIRKFLVFKGKGNSFSGHSSVPAKGQSKQNIPSSSNASKRNKTHGAIDHREDEALMVKKAKQKTGSGDEVVSVNPRKDGPQHLFESNIKSNNAKKDNIKGFPSASSGIVKHVDVSSASRSNVHGFGRNGSPVRKKPNRGSGSSIGSRKGNGTTTGGGFSGSTGIAKKGRGGGGLAVRGRGGSTTMTVKGNTKTEAKPDHKTDEKNGSSGSSAVFQGNGFTLGGSGARVSRLLSINTSAVSQSVKASSLQTEKNSAGEGSVQNSHQMLQNNQYSLEQDGNHSSRCPLCDRGMTESELNQHLDDCMGMFEDSMDLSEKSEDEFVPSLDSSMQDLQSSDEIILDTTNEEISEESVSNNNRMSGNRRKNDSIRCDDEREVYPCPVCGEKFSQSAMNPHLDSHF